MRRQGNAYARGNVEIGHARRQGNGEWQGDASSVVMAKRAPNASAGAARKQDRPLVEQGLKSHDERVR